MRRAPFAFLVVLSACGPEGSGPVMHDAVGSRADELRPTDTSSAEMWKYLATDVVEHHQADGGFTVHFTRGGKNGVPTADADDSGVPDLVEQTGAVYASVASAYQQQLGYRAPLSDVGHPDNGGDGRFDVYLLDFNLNSDGAFRVDGAPSGNSEQAYGYVVQENDFAGYGYPSFVVATRILGSHEYFHATQDAYDSAQDVVVTEGTAVWATEQFDPSTNDFEGFVGGYLSRPDRSLDSPPPGPVPSFAYGSAIFFEYLTERFDRDVVRKLWEHLENGKGYASEPQDVANPKWMVQLDAELKADYGASFAQAFREFATWNLSLAGAANPAISYKEGANYPAVAMTAASAPFQQLPVRVYYASAQYFRLDAAGRQAMTAALVDDPASADDDTTGLALVLTARGASGKNGPVVTVADPKAGVETVATASGSNLVVAVINTARESNGAILSKKPGLCIGTVAEVTACKAALNASLAPDAGTPTTIGAVAGDLGTVPTGGCGCDQTSASTALFLVLLLPFVARRRVP